MQSLIKTPGNSLLLINNVFNDKRLGKNAFTRWSRNIIYSLIRRTFNVSLNNIDKYYSNKYEMPYCVNKVETLMKRSHFGRNTVIASLNDLEKYGYIQTIYNRSRHVKFIFMPLVMEYELMNSNIINQARLSHKHGTFTTQTYSRLSDKLRCNDHNNNDHNIVSTHSDIPEPKLIQWIRNYGLGKSINSYLIKHNDNLTNAYHEAHKIIDIKNNVNQNNGVKYRSSYFNSENNPYIQNGGLLSALKNGKNISKDYEHYLKNHHKPNDTYNSKSIKKHHYNKEEHALLSNKPEKLHRTPKKLQNKIKKQLKQMDEPKNQCNDSNTPKKSTSKTDNNVTMDNRSNSTKNSTEAKESKQKSTYKVNFTPKVTNKSGKIVKSEMGTGLFGNHPKIANKDIYTVIKSKLPDNQKVIINAQNGTKTVTLGQLRKHDDYQNKNIDKPFLKDVNKFTMMVYSEKRLDPLEMV